MVIFFRTFYTMIHWMPAWIFSIALNMFVDASRSRCLTHCIRPWQICSFMPCFYWCLLRYLITGPMTLRRQLPCAAQKLIYAQHSRAFCYTSFLWLLAVLLLAVLLRDVMQNAQWARASTFFALFSFGVLNAVDRGNIILLAAGLSLFFVMYHRSKRAWVQGTGIGCTGSSSRT